MIVDDLGQLAYRAAWERQEQVHARVQQGAAERILLVEHHPVITFGRRGPGAGEHLLAGPDDLARLGVDVVESDRGGDVTFHGPGQIVAYPILRLNDHGLSVGGYVRALEHAVIATLAVFGVAARRDPGAIGVWTDLNGSLAKICAIGVRIRRGVSMHGLALNHSVDLRYFNLIVPCGLVGRPITGIAQLLGKSLPNIGQVKAELVSQLTKSLLETPKTAKALHE